MFGLRELLLRIIRDAGDLARRWWRQYERHISTGALLLGFVIDYLTLTRIDRVFDNLVLVSYLVAAFVCIGYLHWFRGRFGDEQHTGPMQSSTHRIAAWAGRAAPVVMQFAFGGLFSGLLIFYGRSATLAENWPFVLLLAALMIGNEFFQKGYQRLTFQVSILYFAVFSYWIFTVPMLVGTIAPWVFGLSTLVSLLTIGGFGVILTKIQYERYQRARTGIRAVVAGITTGVLILYMSNVIPPLPLSLQTARVAHSVERVGDRYRVRLEPRSVLDYLRPADTFHAGSKNRIYLFSSVFAPTDLKVTVVHEWQRWDPSGERWRTKSRVSFPVRGGRDGGYRGYSFTDQGRPGDWRVSIRTDGGLLIGRTSFTVTAAEPTELTTRTY